MNKLIQPCRVLFLGLSAIAIIAAAASADYEIPWRTIDSGGTLYCEGGPYALAGTIGQPDAGPTSGVMAGGQYTLTGGFWVGSSDGCACPGDMNGDGVKNGADIQAFVLCYLSGAGCSCANVDGAAGVNDADVAAFVAELLAGGVCP